MYIPLVKSKKITGEMLFMCDNVKELNKHGITVDVPAGFQAPVIIQAPA